SAPMRNAAAIFWVVVAAVLGLFGGSRGRVLILIAFAGILSWWLTLRPTQDADWQPDVAHLAYANIEGDQLTVHDIRNFDYRTATFTIRSKTNKVVLWLFRKVSHESRLC